MGVKLLPRANLAAASPYTAANWILDSGATHHLTTDLNNLSVHQPYNGGEEVTIADGSGLAISHTGSALLPTPSRSFALNQVLYVPNLHKNLVSVYRLCNSNQVSVEFFPAHFQVKDLSTGARLLQGKTRNELYEWPIPSPTITSLYASPTSKTNFASWHARLGHPSSAVFKSLVSQFSLPVSASDLKPFSCFDCLLNKTHKLPFHTNSIHSNRPLQYIYSDVWSSPLISQDGYKYYVIFVDHYTRYTWLYPLKLKSQVLPTFIAFQALVEKRFNQKIVTLYSDNGGEFIGLRAHLTAHGISHLTSPPHTPEHNGISERKHRHIVETGLTLLNKAAVPKKFWPYAFAAAVYLINRMPTPFLNNTSPYHKLFGQQPNYLKLRVFGSLCFPWLRPYTNNKLDDRSAACVFIGYSVTQSAYLCLEPQSGRVYTSRHVRFVEDTFPFRTSTTSSPPPTQEPPPSSSTNTFPVLTINRRSLRQTRSTAPPSSDHHQNVSPAPTSADSSASMEDANLSIPSSHSTRGDQTSCEGTSSGMITHSLTGTETHPSSPLPTSETPLPNPPPETTQTETSEPQIPPPSQPELPANRHSMTTRSKNNIAKPKTKLSLNASTRPIIPTTINQALRDPKWRNACTDEFNAITRNHTYDLVPPAPHQNVIDTKWLFTLKYLPNGDVDRHKSRLVARGFNQQYGLDYAETFSPIIKSTTVRLVLEHAVRNDWSIRQLDVNNAFLQGTLEDELYISQPPGFVDKDRPHHVCRLRKALYGLKQAPRAWYEELKRTLLAAGFRNSVADTSLFVYTQNCHHVYVLVYVDDILVTGSSITLVNKIIATLASRFSIKDLGNLFYFLGIEATRTKQGLHLMQRKYIHDLLTKLNMFGAKPVSTPLATHPKLTLKSGQPLQNPSEYRKVVGSLQYLAFTRPDIAFAVNKLSQFMHQPTDEHWQATKRVLRYLAGTMSHGIFLRKSSPLNLHAYSDADWAGDPDDYVSTNAYILYIGSSPISWSAKKQSTVARSSTEAEYRAVANTASELRWVCSLLTELGIPLPTVPVIYCDNVGATYLCANPVFHTRMKHVALDYHFIRANVQSGALRVSHVSTKDQLADALTKSLPRQRFQELFSKIGVTQVPPSCGGV